MRIRTRELRAAPHRLLTVLLYGDFPWCRLLTAGHLVLSVKQAAAHLRIRPARVVDHAKWLHDVGLVTLVEATEALLVVRLVVPRFLDGRVVSGVTEV